ncbi:TPA: 50S ribosomal protein L29 [Candidatus Spyradomonas excrementavium]|nr:50S ribosomal protein L29 [Candidatus Spyradomonas excrementavium]
MKLQEIREKSIDELNELIKDSKKQLLDLRMQKALQKLENTAQIGKLKTVIAQAKTVIKEKSEVK